MHLINSHLTLVWKQTIFFLYELSCHYLFRIYRPKWHYRTHIKLSPPVYFTICKVFLAMRTKFQPCGCPQMRFILLVAVATIVPVHWKQKMWSLVLHFILVPVCSTTAVIPMSCVSAAGRVCFIFFDNYSLSIFCDCVSSSRCVCLHFDTSACGLAIVRQLWCTLCLAKSRRTSRISSASVSFWLCVCGLFRQLAALCSSEMSISRVSTSVHIVIVLPHLRGIVCKWTAWRTSVCSALSVTLVDRWTRTLAVPFVWNPTRGWLLKRAISRYSCPNWCAWVVWWHFHVFTDFHVIAARGRIRTWWRGNSRRLNLR